MWPIPGALLAALVFREGIHSSHFGAYVALTLLFNFLLFGGLTYLITMAIGRAPKSLSPSTGKAKAELPAKGIIYTESEIADFRKCGLM